MQIPREIRTRVARLINSTADGADLDRLFLWARERPYGHWSIKDVGDFVAHWGERESGFTWEHANSVFTALAAHIALEVDKNITMPRLKAGLIASCEIDDPALVKRDLKVGHNTLKKTLKSAIEKIESFDVDKFHYIGSFNNLEREALIRYTGRFTIKPVFDQQSLISELKNYLLKMRLIGEEEIELLASQSDLIGAYVVSKMTTCKIICKEFEPILLSAGIDRDHDGQDNLIVWAGTQISTDLGRPSIQFPIFRTRCLVDDWCERDLLETGTNEPVGLQLLGRRLVPVI